MQQDMEKASHLRCGLHTINTPTAQPHNLTQNSKSGSRLLFLAKTNAQQHQDAKTPVHHNWMTLGANQKVRAINSQLATC
jgi:hypothetical protein